MFKRLFPLLIVLALTMTGCFQRAGDAFESVPVLNTPTIEPLLPTTDPALINPTSDAQVLPTDIPLPTDVPPTQAPPPTEALPANVTVLPPDAQVDITIIAPTSAAPNLAASPTPMPTIDTQPTAQQGFRTPAPPLGPVTITPFVSTDLQATNTPSGLITPTAFTPATVSADAPCTYTIQRGDTLFRIATDNGVTLVDLRAANPQISGDLIQPGDLLTLPNCEPGSGQIAPPLPTVEPTLPAPGPGGQTSYEIQPGDTLFNIARRFGVTVDAIVAANQISNPDRLRVGDTLIIPPPAP